jgi:hypothetical protein
MSQVYLGAGALAPSAMSQVYRGAGALAPSAMSQVYRGAGARGNHHTGPLHTFVRLTCDLTVLQRCHIALTIAFAWQVGEAKRGAPLGPCPCADAGRCHAPRGVP